MMNTDVDELFEDAGGSERYFYLTDAQFSVIAVMDDAANLKEKIQYDACGRAIHHDWRDGDGDGDYDATDRSNISTIAVGANNGIGQANYEADADVDRDGDIDSNDLTLAGTTYPTALSRGELSYSDVGNTIGYDGYVFNPVTELYTVRFRTYSTMLGRWLERDPAGYVSRTRTSLLSYSDSDPSTSDPLGLFSLKPPYDGSGWRKWWLPHHQHGPPYTPIRDTQPATPHPTTPASPGQQPGDWPMPKSPGAGIGWIEFVTQMQRGMKFISEQLKREKQFEINNAFRDACVFNNGIPILLRDLSLPYEQTMYLCACNPCEAVEVYRAKRDVHMAAYSRYMDAIEALWDWLADALYKNSSVKRYLFWDSRADEYVGACEQWKAEKTARGELYDIRDPGRLARSTDEFPNWRELCDADTRCSKRVC